MSLKTKKRSDVPPGPFQKLDKAGVDRTDCVWFLRADGSFKCCLCGAVTTAPPGYPTPAEFVPKVFELPLTKEERLMCPNPNATVGGPAI